MVDTVGTPHRQVRPKVLAGGPHPPAKGLVAVSPYDRFPRIPRWRRELRVTLPALMLVTLIVLTAKLLLPF
jgi:hypothetical protein